MTARLNDQTVLIVYSGPMFAGKTSALIKAWNNCDNVNKLAFKYKKDTRYESGDVAIVSHDQVTLPAIPVCSCEEINTYINNSCETIKDHCQLAIFIDEGQFFPDIYDWFVSLDSKQVSDVYISGLDYDIFGKVFSEQFDKLANNATVLYSHSAKCYICGQQANRTQFMDSSQLSNVEGNVLIGGELQFQPACDTHFKPCVTA